MNAVRWPAKASPGRSDGLWRHTCLELFVRTEQPGYCEVNIAPSGRWAAYRFDAVRKGMRNAPATASLTTVTSTAEVYQLAVSIDLPDMTSGETWHFGASAVVEAVDGTKSYWALHHPSDVPDFHHPDSFVLELPAMR